MQLETLIQLINADILTLNTVRSRKANTAKNALKDISGTTEATLVTNAQFLDVNFVMQNNLEITSFQNV